MASPGDLDALSPTELKALVVQLLGKAAIAFLSCGRSVRAPDAIS